MSNKPISFVVASYEKKDILRRVLESFNVRCNKDDEIVVVDDGSSDSTQDFIKQYSPSCKYKYKLLEDKGYRLSTVRNVGIDMATNDCIIQSDDDYLLTNRLVEKAREIFEPSSLVIFRRDERDKNGSILPDERIIKDYRKEKIDKNLFKFRPYGQPEKISGAWGLIMYSKDKMQELGGYNEKFDGRWGAEDCFVVTKFAYSGVDILYYVGSRCIHEDHKKREGREEEAKENRKLLKEELKKLKNKNMVI